MFKELFTETGDYTGEVYETGSEFSAKEANTWVKKISKLGYIAEKMKYIPKFYALMFRNIIDLNKLEKDLKSIGFTEKVFMS